MTTGKCKINECGAPKIPCYEGNDYLKCQHWIANNLDEKVKKEKPILSLKGTKINWSGEALLPEEISKISYRTTPIIIGLVGTAKAAKTTFLAMIYTLLLNGYKLKNYEFSGTKTALGWDQLYFKLKVLKQNVSFPDPTPVSYLRLLHLALKNNENILKDVLISDASGEVFSLWAHNKKDELAENARWIYKNSDGFILFIDCQSLVTNLSKAKTEIIDIAQQLTSELKNRPVVCVWSKSDKKNEINEKIKKTLKTQLIEIIPNFYEIDISNFSKKEPDMLVHTNNLIVLNSLLDKMCIVSDIKFESTNNPNSDIFFKFRNS